MEQQNDLIKCYKCGKEEEESSSLYENGENYCHQCYEAEEKRILSEIGAKWQQFESKAQELEGLYEQLDNFSTNDEEQEANTLAERERERTTWNRN